MDHVELLPAPGRYPFPLTARWTAVVIEPLPGALAVGLFLDGQPVEVIDEPEDVRDYLRTLLAARRPSRALADIGAARSPRAQT